MCIRTHVLSRAAQCPRSFANFKEFTQPEIGQFDVILIIEQNILGLQIAVNDAGVMQEIWRRKG